MIFVSAGIGISTTFALALQCMPIDKLWNPIVPGSCFDVIPFYFGASAMDTVSDIIIYVLPMKLLVRDLLRAYFFVFGGVRKALIPKNYFQDCNFFLR
jgi:hypothetical protein